jgi:hypothetical protein
MRIPRFRQRSLLGVRRRAGALLRRWLHNRFVPAKRVRVVTLSGRRYKRLSLSDAARAREIAAHLAALRPTRCFPELVAAVDAELLLEYVEGRTLADPIEPARLDALAGFYARLYGAAPRRLATAASAFPAELARDLAFLRDVGVLDAAAHSDVSAAAHALQPAEVWVGWDYLDPLPRNFVVADDGRLVAVDVEDLWPDRLLGGGVAKARLRSLGAHGERLPRALAAACSLDLAPALPWVELHFLAEWTKLAYLKGRHALVDPARFEPYRAKGSTGASLPDTTR